MRINSDITFHEEDSYYDASYEFVGDKFYGLQVAFAITAYDGNYEMMNETEYAQLKA